MRRARIGVISDTHGLLRPEALAALGAGAVELIVHAGDIGGPEILRALERIAPVVAVRGNNDVGKWAEALPETTTVVRAKTRLFVMHALSKDFDAVTMAPGARVVIAGHSHKPSAVEKDGVLFLNPGSAGPRRFSLPVTMAFLDVGVGPPRETLVSLVPTARARAMKAR